jgi:hypothetical protein
MACKSEEEAVEVVAGPPKLAPMVGRTAALKVVERKSEGRSGGEESLIRE